MERTADWVSRIFMDDDDICKGEEYSGWSGCCVSEVRFPSRPEPNLRLILLRVKL